MNANNYVALWEAVNSYSTLSTWISEPDMAYVKDRVSAEGICFLTTELPKLGKSLDAAFESGVLEIPAGFAKARTGNYPKLFQRCWETLFDENGLLRWYEDSPNGLVSMSAEAQDDYAGAALAIRQSSLMYYKLKLPYSDDQIARTMESFISTEADLSKLDNFDFSISPVLTRARQLVRRLLGGSNPQVDIRPQHGSGASACGTKPWARYGKPRYFSQIDGVYPYTEWFVSGLAQVAAEWPNLWEDSDETVPVAKIVFVPKDSRGPRMISEEPRETMYLQKGLMALLYEIIEHYPRIRAMLSCTDQTRNRFACVWASMTGAYATLDMKEASDRVSVKLVEYLFPENWVRCLMATRSTATKLPDGKIFPLKKFAPMGSATCFPVEAITFWAIGLAAIEAERGYLEPKLFSLSPYVHGLSSLYVFGDDLIVPTNCAKRVITELESVGLKTNVNKCFTRGPFRESCGVDAFQGFDITPIRASHLIVEPGSGFRDEIAYSRHRLMDAMNNLICRYGCTLTAPFRDLFQRIYGIKLDVLEIETYRVARPPGLYLLGAATEVRVSRFNRDLHYWEFRSEHERAKVIDISIKGTCGHLADWSQLNRWSVNHSRRDSLKYVSPARRYRYKMGWSTIVK